jgi:hypothetical protein
MKYIIRDKASGNEVFGERYDRVYLQYQAMSYLYATQAEAEASLRGYLCSDELMIEEVTP